MITIKSIEIKQTKTGKDYKFLTLADDTKVAMWLDDPDYEIAVDGADLEREIQKKGNWFNLLPKGERVTHGQAGSNKNKLDAIYYVLQNFTKKYDDDMAQVFKHIGLEYTPFERLEKVEETDIIDDISPEDIPF